MTAVTFGNLNYERVRDGPPQRRAGRPSSNPESSWASWALPFIVLRTEKPFVLDPHCQVEQTGEDRRHLLRAVRDQLFHNRLNSRMLSAVQYIYPCPVGFFMEIHYKL